MAASTRAPAPTAPLTPVQRAWRRLRAHALVCGAPERCEVYRDLDGAYARLFVAREREARAS